MRLLMVQGNSENDCWLEVRDLLSDPGYIVYLGDCVRRDMSIMVVTDNIPSDDEFGHWLDARLTKDEQQELAKLFESLIYVMVQANSTDLEECDFWAQQNCKNTPQDLYEFQRASKLFQKAGFLES